MKPKVLVTRTIPENGLALLRKHCTIKVYSKDQAIPRWELLRGVKWCDALLCLLTDKIDKTVIDANPKLKIISNYAVGYDNIDVHYAASKKIPVTNTPGMSDDAVAEHTFTLMLALTRKIVEADHFTRSGKYQGWQPYLFLGHELKGKTLGIVGLGRIGSGVAQRAGCMKLNVMYHDIRRNPAFERQYQAQFVSLKKLLRTADFVSLHVPLLPSTKHLISSKQLKMMKKTAYLINTSRGPVVDEKALVAALRTRTIAGAGLDVYEFEPRLTAGLARLPNVILTPHTASSTAEARAAMADLAVRNILLALQGQKPLTVVDPEIYK